MKKTIILFLVILLSSQYVYAAFCCRDIITDQEKCYIDGECCAGYWYPSCYDFDFDIFGPRSFRVGQPTPITIYLQNIGALSDSFTITVVNDNPTWVEVDMTDANSVSNLVQGNSIRLYPKIKVLSSTATATLNFIVTSLTSGDSKTKTFYITETDYFLSLPEFSVIGFIEMISLIGIIYFISRQKYFR
jgi:hypothetical protein